MKIKVFECIVCHKQLHIPDSSPEEVKKQREAMGFFMVDDNYMLMVCSEFCSQVLKEENEEENG